jgi:predicted RNA-binding Zn ribbon-like protein
MKHASGPAPDPGDVGRLPAPTDLELVRALINSRNIEGEATVAAPSSTWDKLATAAAAEAWLRERGLIGAKIRLNAAEAAQLRALREALRGLAARSNGLDLRTDVALLQRAAERAKFGLGFDPRTGRSELRPTAGGVAGAVGRILGEVHEAMHDGTWQRLKICAADTCLWAYYDRSKNSHSRWCSPAVCGNRDKVRRYRERARKSVGKRR